ncbi:MAG: hypothetical protein QXT77_00705 [Candidatus Methanomethylicaceae archaeon]
MEEILYRIYHQQLTGEKVKLKQLIKSGICCSSEFISIIETPQGNPRTSVVGGIEVKSLKFKYMVIPPNVWRNGFKGTPTSRAELARSGRADVSQPNAEMNGYSHCDSPASPCSLDMGS